MNYQQFKETILFHLKKQYPEELYELTLRKVTKNNGMHLDGICIFKKGEHVAPTIYLNSYYEEYLKGMILADLLCEIREAYEEGMKNTPSFKIRESYYEAVRDQIILRLVNFDMNREILEDCPYVRFQDLAVSFRWLAYQDEIGISTALISNQEMKQWGISVDQLYEDALKNTQRLFPCRILSFRELMREHRMPEDCSYCELHILTNDQGINGATCVLYEDVLKEFAHRHKMNFYLLPSSIHEMMICLDYEAVSKDMLLSLVKEANHMVVAMGEVLSDNIYYYDYKKETLTLVENS